MFVAAKTLQLPNNCSNLYFRLPIYWLLINSYYPIYPNSVPGKQKIVTNRKYVLETLNIKTFIFEN